MPAPANPDSLAWSASAFMDETKFTAVARMLAAVFVESDFSEQSLVEAGSRLLGRKWRWLRPLTRRIRAKFEG